jgi:putative ABC transport system permease protein
VVRGRVAADALEADVRDTVRDLDARLAVAGLRPLTETVTASAAPERFNMAMMVGFAAMALLLAAIGIYGVVGYAVAQRTREIGVRTALGADAGRVVRLILGEGVRLAALGIAIGTTVAALLAPLLRALLFGVKPLDTPTFVAVALLLLSVAVTATYVPARRAAHVDPTIALRSE